MKHPLLLAVFLSAPVAAQADILPGEFPCTSCHGADGLKSAPGQPGIGGRPAEALFAILQDYLHLRRINPAMPVLLLGMSDWDVEDVAEYFSLADPTETR